MIYPDQKPKTRGECYTMPRPCPFVSCRYHLATDEHVDNQGRVRLRIANEHPEDMEHTCALDVADAGVQQLSEIAEASDLHKSTVQMTFDRALREFSLSAPDGMDEQFWSAISERYELSIVDAAPDLDGIWDARPSKKSKKARKHDEDRQLAALLMGRDADTARDDPGPPVQAGLAERPSDMGC